MWRLQRTFFFRRLPGDPDGIGPFPFGFDSTYISTCPEVLDNSSIFCEIVDSFDLVVSNIFFCKRNEHKATHHLPGAPSANFCTPHYGETEHVLVQRRYRNQIKDVTTDTATYFNTDHFMQITKIQCKLRQGFHRTRSAHTKYVNPTDTQLKYFNAAVRANLNAGHNTLHGWRESVVQAAVTTLTPDRRKPHQAHISDDTLQLIRQRQRIFETNGHSEEPERLK